MGISPEGVSAAGRHREGTDPWKGGQPLADVKRVMGFTANPFWFTDALSQGDIR